MDRYQLIPRLAAARREQCFPGSLHASATEIADRLLGLLFPHYAIEGDCSEVALRREADVICMRLRDFAQSIESTFARVDPTIPDTLMGCLPEIYELLLEDAQAIDAGDPAALSVDEVILSYPGFFAIAIQRLAHRLYALDMPLLPRLLTEYAHSRTGIDIHPGATIGRRFFIDHGTGIVIGQTAEIGDDVKLYQGVTLGAMTVSKNFARRKRHPTLQDHVVVYANATVLGGDTVVGEGSIIGGNVWLTYSVPARSVVSHRPEVHIRAPGEAPPLEYHI